MLFKEISLRSFCIKWKIVYGTDSNAEDVKGNKALHVAARHRNIEVMELLIETSWLMLLVSINAQPQLFTHPTHDKKTLDKKF